MKDDVSETNEALEDTFKKLFENPVVQWWILCNLFFEIMKMLKEVLYVPPSIDE